MPNKMYPAFFLRTRQINRHGLRIYGGNPETSDAFLICGTEDLVCTGRLQIVFSVNSVHSLQGVQACTNSDKDTQACQFYANIDRISNFVSFCAYIMLPNDNFDKLRDQTLQIVYAVFMKI